MAMNLRIDDADAEVLRVQAQREGRTMSDVAHRAISEYIARQERLAAAAEMVRSADAALLERLGG